MPLRTMIVDDEPAGRERLLDLLAHEDAEVVAACEDAEEARQVLDRGRPVDVVFLDVQMPGGEGFSVLEGRDRAARPVVVFVTAHDRHALRAFDEEAVDFLLKPYDQERFREALRRARGRVEARRRGVLEQRLGDLLEGAQASATPSRLVVRAAGRISFLRVEDIEWLDAAGNSVRIHGAGKVHRIRESLQNLERQLDPRRFARIHRSTIVNLDRLREVLVNPHGDYVVVTETGQRLTVGRSFRDRIQALVRPAN